MGPGWDIKECHPFKVCYKAVQDRKHTLISNSDPPLSFLRKIHKAMLQPIHFKNRQNMNTYNPLNNSLANHTKHQTTSQKERANRERPTLNKIHQKGYKTSHSTEQKNNSNASNTTKKWQKNYSTAKKELQL